MPSWPHDLALLQTLSSQHQPGMTNWALAGQQEIRVTQTGTNKPGQYTLTQNLSQAFYLAKPSCVFKKILLGANIDF